MTLRHIKIFKAICENGCNTTKAARAMSMTQPAVSMAIKELESYYGVTLFNRIGRRLSITKAGEKLLEYSARITAIFDDMEDRLKDWDAYAPIKVGATATPGSFLLPEYLKKFKDSFPQTQVDVSVSSCYGLEERLLDGDIDFALVEGQLYSPLLLHFPFCEDRLRIVVSPRTGYENGQIVPAAELKNINLLLREKNCITRKLFESVISSTGLSFTPYLESFDYITLISFAINGIGAAVVPYRTAQHIIKYGKLNEIKIEGLDFNRKLYIVLHKDKHCSRSAKEFIKICYEFENP